MKVFYAQLSLTGQLVQYISHDSLYQFSPLPCPHGAVAIHATELLLNPPLFTKSENAVLGCLPLTDNTSYHDGHIKKRRSAGIAATKGC